LACIPRFEHAELEIRFPAGMAELGLERIPLTCSTLRYVSVASRQVGGCTTTR
jgi:hypothetical protein